MSELFKKSDSSDGAKTTSLSSLRQQRAANAGQRLKKPKEVPLKKLPAGPFRAELREFLDELATEDRQLWTDTFEHAFKERTKTNPSEKWLTQGESLMTSIGSEDFARTVIEFASRQKLDPKIDDPSIDVLRGLLKLCVFAPSDEVALSLGQLGIRSFRKVPNYGARSQKVGNTTIWALEQLALKGNDAAVPELVRLRDETSYELVHSKVNDALAAVASDRSTSQVELEANCLPSFGFDDGGPLTKRLGDYTGEVALSASGAKVEWTDADGKVTKRVPAALKQSQPDEADSLVRFAKNISQVLANQADLLEVTLIGGENWAYSEWAQKYLDHPIRRPVAAGLIWVAATPAAELSFTMTDGVLTDVSGEPIETPAADTPIRLWHPADATDSELAAWKEHTSGIEQPFKQTNREIYGLTNRERGAVTSMDRFDSATLRYSQLRALLGKRGWKYQPDGFMNTEPSQATRAVPARGLSAKFLLTPTFAHALEKRGSRPSRATIGPLRFTDTDDSEVALEDVPASTMSEILRDMDLFTTVSDHAIEIPKRTLKG